MKQPLHRKRARSIAGSSLSEVPPALFLLLFCAVFPALNLIALGLAYSSCIFLNNMELREAAKTPNSLLPSAVDSLTQKWQSAGIGQLAGVITAPETNISYDKIGTDPYVTVATTFTIKSLFTIPFFKGIPGLGAPLTFTVASKRLLEDPSYATL